MTTPNPDQTSRFSAENDSVASPGALRCSDAEREQTSAKLHAAAGEGRLSMDEVEERLAKTYAARYRHDLDAVTADLPAASVTTGWGSIVALARQQLADDLAALTGRGRVEVSRRRKVVVALAALAVLLCAVAMVILALHGIAGEGHEHHGFGQE
jgi:Domain of unknown function (DUF1707)